MEPNATLARHARALGAGPDADPVPRHRPPLECVPEGVTRLHLRYDAQSFPEDLVFQETGDRQNFQGRYIVRHAWNGSPNACPAARHYFDNLRQRQEREVQTLANLTGWKVEDIRRGVSALAPPPEETPKKQPTWWEQLWDGGQ